MELKPSAAMMVGVLRFRNNVLVHGDKNTPQVCVHCYVVCQKDYYGFGHAWSICINPFNVLQNPAIQVCPLHTLPS